MKITKTVYEKINKIKVEHDMHMVCKQYENNFRHIMDFLLEHVFLSKHFAFGVFGLIGFFVFFFVEQMLVLANGQLAKVCDSSWGINLDTIACVFELVDGLQSLTKIFLEI